MGKFTVRVELHQADYSDYVELHKFMEEVGYKRVIQGDSGRWFELPPAEYYGEGNVTAEGALEYAKRAAERTGRTFGVLVTEGETRAWWNLPVVKV